MTEQRTITTSGQAEAVASPRTRLQYLDNLRVLLTVLVVLHHAALTYGNIPLWYYSEPAQDASGGLLDVLVMLNQTFFMGLFFMISGYFVPGSYDRKGARSFIRGRLVRLGIPLLLFLLVLRPIVGLGGYLDGAAGEIPYPLYYVLTWDPGPMWFVETLLVFCLGYVLIRRVRTSRAQVPARETGRMPGPAPVIGFVAVLISLTYVWRMLVPAGTYWPVVGLPTPAFLPQYVLLFVVGALAFRNGWFDRIPRAYGRLGLAAAIGAIVVFGPLLTTAGDAITRPGTWQSLASAAFESIFATGLILFLVVVFQRRFHTQRRWGRFLSDHSYAVYFLHPAVLVGLGYAFRGWQAAAIAKFAVVAVLALPLCWAAAYLLRSLPNAKRVF
jgi:peptidoglycan/LPS O-acetylase OafA/YrhL